MRLTHSFQFLLSILTQATWGLLGVVCSLFQEGQRNICLGVSLLGARQRYQACERRSGGLLLLAVCSVPFCIRGLGGTGVPRSSVPFWCNDWVALEYGSVGVSTPRDLPGEEIRMAFFPAGGLGRSRGVGRGGCHSGMELFEALLIVNRRSSWVIFVLYGLVTRLVSSGGKGVVWEMGCLLSCWCVGAAVGDAHSLCVRSYGCLDSQVDFCWGSL